VKYQTPTNDLSANPTNERGFTLIELMVALSIAAVMMMYAIPSFRVFTEQREMASNVNSMVGAINYARSEAVRLGSTVSVQAIDGADADDEWGQGFCVTVGNPGDCDDPLRRFDLEGTPTFDAIDGLNDEDSMSFDSRGLIRGGLLGAVQLCATDAETDPGRVVNVNAIGRASVTDLVCYP
jgi:type IV fimbrial biogenesis protein FimT